MKIFFWKNLSRCASARILTCSIACLAAAAAASHAQDWVGDTSQNWNDPANWSSNAYPTGLNAIVNTDAAGIFPIISANTAQVADTIIGNQPGGKARLDHRAGIHRTGTARQTLVGVAGSTGIYNLANTSIVDSTNITGFAMGSGTLHAGSRLYVGDGTGTGTLNINTSGSINVTMGSSGNGFYIGDTGTGTVNLHRGTVNDYQTVVGGVGTGHVNIAGGTWNTNHWTFIGQNAESIGEVAMTGGTWNQNHTDYLNIGLMGDGTFVMSGGVLNNPSLVDTSTRLTNKGNVIVGRFTDPNGGGGSGFWDLKGTATANVSRVVVGEQTGATGRLDISQSAQLISRDHDLIIGQSGKGAVNVNGGSASFNQGWVFVGTGTGGEGTLNVNAGSISARDFRVGQEGRGKVNVTGTGQLSAIFGIMIGDSMSGSGHGEVEVSGGIVSAQSITVAERGMGRLSVEGGMVTATDMVLGFGAGSRGTVIQTGGTVALGGTLELLQFGATGSYSLSAGVLSVDGVIGAIDGDFNFTGGMLTRSNAGMIQYFGDLDTDAPGATLGLQSGKTINVAGTLDILDGITLDLAGLTIPAALGPTTGSYLLGSDFAIDGTFTPLTTTVLNLNNLAGATMISEIMGEAGLYSPGDPVFWIQEDNTSHQISLRYSVPEPSAALLVLLGGSLGVLIRRRA